VLSCRAKADLSLSASSSLHLQKAYDLVWQESAKVFDDMVQGEGWAKAKSGDKFHLKDFVEITMSEPALLIFHLVPQQE
jgi:hypothetical protein